MKRAIQFCFALVPALVTQLAFAQPNPSDTAEAHVQRGLELRRTGDDATALVEFERARDLAPTPRVRAQVGLALQALGRWREAEEVVIQVLSDEADPWVHDHADLLHESLAAVQHHLAWLAVDCNVAGARLLVNGDSVATLPLHDPVRVGTGNVVIQVQAVGYEPFRRTISLSEGDRARESVLLVEHPLAPDVANAPPGTAGAPDPAAVKRASGWAILAAGGVVLAGGATAAAISAAYAGTYNNDSQCFVWPLSRDQRCGDDRGVAEATLVTAIVALTVGSLAVGAGVYLVATAPSKQRGVGAVTLDCGAGPGSLGCVGSF